MAPIEVEFRGLWQGRHQDFTLEPGALRRIEGEEAMVQIRCNRKDLGGQVFLVDHSTELSTPNRGHGLEIPPAEIVKATAKINVPADEKSPVSIKVMGETVAVVQHRRRQ